MRDTYQCGGWACTDCTMLIANGEAPTEMTADELAEYLARYESRNAGFNVTLGMLREDHDCYDAETDTTATDRGADECYCEQVSFTWSSCDVCGSNLGGSRNAVAFFKIAETASA